ncbi:MAG: glycosyltransferase family 39 protein [Myxococcota bacterium]|nr:glycosyltransferase family 39 protein [Myxococcota bacterium]
MIHESTPLLAAKSLPKQGWSTMAPAPRSETTQAHRLDRSFWPLLAVLLLLAAVLRAGHAETSWSYWTMDYLSYYGPLRDDLSQGLFPWTRLVGLHPPLHGLTVSGILALGGSVAWVYGLSMALSLGAALLAAIWLRRVAGPECGLLAAALLATSPYQVHYGIEFNNYPLFLFGAAALTVCFPRVTEGSSTPRSRLILLLGAAFLTLHGHLAGLSLVGLLFAVACWQRRAWAAAALASAVLLFVPVGRSILRMRNSSTTFHNEPLVFAELGRDLIRSWLERFGGAMSLSAALLALAIAALLALRNPRTRAAALLLAALLVTNVLTTLAGMASGAAQVLQTPYWVFASWCAWVLIALGWSAARGPSRAVLAGVLAVWLGGVVLHGHRTQQLPPQGASDEASLALAGYLDRHFGAGDVVVYLWDPLFPNDDPVSRDALFSVFSPWDLKDWSGREQPCRNYGFVFGEGLACFVVSAGMRGDEYENSLRTALPIWLSAGRTIHLVQASIDPQRAALDDGPLKARVAGAGGSWMEERPGGIRVQRISPAEAL